MSEAIRRLTAALADRYLIERELGQGGMATVYLAEDSRHKRKVALKVLKPELAAVVGAERFLTEIRTTVNLQHPHILPLFDSGEADGFLYFVMPYVDGESLRERLDREKHLPVDEALRIASEVADALGHAHAQGVIHRDIKPANILLRDGRVQVADFGIALAVQQAGGARLTETGLSVGTPHYMSPEQASGDRQLDGRSDIYSLGCVLYEMLAGEPPHTGPTAQSILSKILTEAPRPLGESRRRVPLHVEAAVRAAIEKLPADRFESASRFRAALTDPSFGVAARTRTATAAKGLGVGIVAGILGGVGLGWGIAALVAGSSSSPGTMSMRQLTFDGSAAWPSLSDDGQWLAYQVTRCPTGEQCRGEVFVQELDGGDPISRGPSVEVGGAEVHPLWFWDMRWSADGRTLLVAAGFADSLLNGIYAVPRVSGAATRIASGIVTSIDYRPGTDTIDWVMFPRGLDVSLAAPVWKTMDLRTQRETTRPFPFPVTNLRWSPDGRWLAVRRWIVGSDTASTDVALLDRDGVLLDAAMLPPSPAWPRVRWLQEGNTLAVPVVDGILGLEVDRRTGMFRGSSRSLASNLQAVGWGQNLVFDVDARGRLVFERYRLRTRLRDLRRLADGSFEARWLASGTGRQDHPSLTEDAQYVAFVRQDPRGLNIYVQPTAGGEPRAVTRSSSLKHHPRWSPDGERLAFVEVDSASWLVTIARDGSGYARVGRLSADATFAPFGWAPDSRALAWEYQGRIWRAELSGEAQAVLPTPTPISRIWGVEVSPGGDSLATLSHYYPGGDESVIQIHIASRSVPDAGWDAVLRAPESAFRTSGADAATLTFLNWGHFSLQPWRLAGAVDIVLAGQRESRDQASVFRIPITGGGGPQLQADLSGYCAGGIVEISATADLSRLVCSEVDATRDIWLVELLEGDERR